MIRSLFVAGIVLVLSASVIAGVLSQSPTTDAGVVESEVEPTPTAEPVVEATPTPTLNRGDCEQIRGTDYHSPEERQWFLANCVRP